MYDKAAYNRMLNTCVHNVAGLAEGSTIFTLSFHNERATTIVSFQSMELHAAALRPKFKLSQNAECLCTSGIVGSHG
jgi:hypothetical protein